MTIKKQIETYIITYNKYIIYLEINYEKNCYNIYNNVKGKIFEFGGIEINKHNCVLKMIYYAVNLAGKKLKDYNK